MKTSTTGGVSIVVACLSFCRLKFNIVRPFIGRCLTLRLRVLLLGLTIGSIAQAADTDPAETLARAILSKMTLEEKISLCAGNSTFALNAIPRVGLAEEFTMSDGPHTVRPDFQRMTFDKLGGEHDYSTSLPPLSALAATWDPAMATKFGMVLGEEARDRNKDMLLGPGVNIMRTPLCGRTFEYLGEDPKLTATLAVPLIKAIQSNNVAACVKHFACNNQEENRNEVNAEVDERALREIYLPAFDAAVREAGVLTVMNGYNRFNGTYCSESDVLNNQILKKEWGFKGFVVTDWGSLHATVEGVRGGTDVEMNAGNSIRFFKQPLLDAVKAGTVSEAQIDAMVLRVLYVMAKVHKIDGLPRKVGSRNTPEHQQTALEVAEAGIVLLKNDQGILPLQPERIKSLVIFGENATNKHCTEGWSAGGKPPYEISPLEGLKKRLGDKVAITWNPLSTIVNVTQVPDFCINTIDTEVKDAGMSIKAWKAEYFNNPELSGEPVGRGFDRSLQFNWKPGSQPKGVGDGEFSARWTGDIVAPETGVFLFGARTSGGVKVFVNDQPVLSAWNTFQNKFVTGEIALELGKVYQVRVEYSTLKSKNRSFSSGWCPPSKRAGDVAAAIAKAKAADAVLIFTGNEHGHGQALESEGGDRPNLKLPEGHDQTIAALLNAAPKAVVINLSGAPVEMPWVKSASTLVQYWFSGQEGGNALAAVLLGDVNPSGKLPCTFPVKLEDSPVTSESLAAKSVAYTEGIFVGYRWYDAKNIEPMFPFGHGLSYTTFTLGKPVVSSATVKPGDSFTVTVAVTNTGSVAGAEVVQLYVADPDASVPRPPKELKGFRKVFLKPGETTQVSMTLTTRDLSFWDVTTHGWKAEPGVFDILVGQSSRKITGQQRVPLVSRP